MTRVGAFRDVTKIHQPSIGPIGVKKTGPLRLVITCCRLGAFRAATGNYRLESNPSAFIHPGTLRLEISREASPDTRPRSE